MKSIILILFLMTSCTIAINQTHTEGTASDVIDETQTTDPKVDPTISLPLKAL